MRRKLGVAVTIAAVALAGLAYEASGGWYAYELLPPDFCGDNRTEDVFLLVRKGWQIVPGQPSPCYLRKSRLALWLEHTFPR